MTNILLVGTSYSEHKGSAALLISSIDGLNRAIPDAHFFVCSTTPKLDKCTFKIPNSQIIPCRLTNSTFELLVAAFALRTTGFSSSAFPMTKYLRDADIIVDISGDSYSSIYGKTSIASLGIRVISAKLLNTPIILYCQSIGPFYGRLDRTVAKFFLKLVDRVTVRESITEKHLKELGVSSYIYADQAFLLKSDPSSLKPFQFTNKEKPIIGINLSQHIDSLYTNKSSNKYRELMIQFIDILIERYDVNILVIPELRKKTVPAYDDYFVSKTIVSQLKHQDHVFIIQDDCSPSTLKAAVGYCSLLVSPRFHMVIFALSQRVPSIAIAYSPKALGIMNMLGQSQYVLNLNDLSINTLLQAVDNIWIDRDKISRALVLEIEKVQNIAFKATEQVQLLLKDHE